MNTTEASESGDGIAGRPIEDTPEILKNAERCIPAIRDSISLEDRKLAAAKLGANWANIMSGFGDQ